VFEDEHAFSFFVLNFDGMASQTTPAQNYVKDDSGSTFIPSTQRADGSWRKQRRVKEGYVPQEEVPLYESKGKQWAKNQPKLPVGMSPVSSMEGDKPKTHYVIPGLLVEEVEPSGIDGKKKKKKKKGKKGGGDTVNEVTEKLSNIQVTQAHTNNETTTNTDTNTDKNEKKGSGRTSPHHPLTELEVMEKKLRKLRDKLRDIESLEKKIETGELKNPDKKQLEKIQRKGQVLTEIEDLVIEIEIAD